MKKYLFIIILSVLGLYASLPVHAAEENDTEYKQLYARFLRLYNSSIDESEEFYKSAEELSAYYRKHDNTLEYYKTQLNICFYDTSHERSLQALERAQEMVNEMKEEGFDAFSHVYLVLGTIFECRGNFNMAFYYYEKSLNTFKDDEDNKANLYLRIANLMLFHNPVEAEYWIKEFNEEKEQSHHYKHISLYIESMINFVLINKYHFQKKYQEYLDYQRTHTDLDSFGFETLKIADMAFKGQFEEALEKQKQIGNNELNNVDMFNMRIVLYKMMNDYPKALETAQSKEKYIDSLNSDMFFTHMNKLNAEIGLAQTKTKADKDRVFLLYIILFLAIIVITMLVLYIIHNRKRKNELKLKNEQLLTALTMAEEGEKMKTEFVRSVSHEIRTPLNAINGFNDILNTPDIPLTEEERADLLQRIKDNIKAITDIVDEMLRVAEKESNELYSKRTKILCNQFFSSQLYQYRDRVSSSIELKYTTRVINRFQIETNEEGLKKIIEQLILNAIKFTKSGSIELHCELTDNDKLLAVSLTDTGKGIADEQQDKIFDGFYKEDIFQQGIGLGLTVSKKIAIKLGGNLVLDKDYKEGARFILTLPV